MPYAGANKYSYAPLVSLFPPEIRTTIIELPGRGARFHEPLLISIEDMVHDVFKNRSIQFDAPYILFGHSMGALLGYLLIKKIIQQGLAAPRHVFFTGCPPPSAKKEISGSHLLSDDEFKNMLKHLGGITDDILDNKDLFELFLPVLRADFKAVDLYVYNNDNKFDIPITVIGGNKDSYISNHLSDWSFETNAEAQIIQMEGDHFFIFKNQAEIIRLILEQV